MSCAHEARLESHGSNLTGVTEPGLSITVNLIVIKLWQDDYDNRHSDQSSYNEHQLTSRRMITSMVMATKTPRDLSRLEIP